MNERTRALITLAQQGDKEKLTKLIEENKGLIWSIVKRFLGRGYEPDDLYQIACIGFIEAIQRFDFDYNVELSTYSVQYMIGEIKKFLRDDGLIRISRSIKELGIKIKELEHIYGKNRRIFMRYKTCRNIRAPRRKYLYCNGSTKDY